MNGARTLKNWIARNPAPEPPRRSEGKVMLSAPGTTAPAETISQINLKVPTSIKHQYRRIAARDGVSMLELFYRMIQAYEEKQKQL